MNSILLDFINVSEDAALAAYPWIGKGSKNEADAASTEAMRNKLNQLNIEGRIVIGEGELDEAPMLFIGEKVGTGKGPKIDIAVDPIDGTSYISKGQDNSITVIAGAPMGCLLHAPDMYMQKIAVGPKASGKVDIDAPLYENLITVARANNKKIKDLKVVVQDRDRHSEIIQKIRHHGASVILFSDVDVTVAIGTALANSNIDLFLGIGGAPEGVLTAVALNCLGGDFQGRLLPQSEEEIKRCKLMGIQDISKKLTLSDIVKNKDCFFVATGITNGSFLKGIQDNNEGFLVTHTFALHGLSGRYHFIESIHNLK